MKTIYRKPTIIVYEASMESYMLSNSDISTLNAEEADADTQLTRKYRTDNWGDLWEQVGE